MSTGTSAGGHTAAGGGRNASTRQDDGATLGEGGSIAEREREYSPSSCIGGNFQPFIQEYVDRSRVARERTPGRYGLAYGAAVSQTLDLFLPLGGAGLAPPPLLVFFHGGYWQELSRHESSFAATHCVEQGWAHAALDYTLAPNASVAQIVAECRAALSWLHANAATLGFDPGRIVIAGSSAGAHLAAMVAMPRPGAVPLQGVVLVSGVYALEPLVGTSINTALGLTAQTAREVSPALMPLRGFARTIVCWGEVETSAFKGQSRDFAAQLTQAGSTCQSFEVPQRNHFDIILDLADPTTLLGRSVGALMRKA